MKSLFGAGFWENIKTIVDIIPKVVYFLYAALASAVDALQLLIRRLAGLDTYWQVTSTGTNDINGQDPLSEFVLGILGIGDSASMYHALNTVFWSLAIFGLIMLVISTMIAIIKSHYNEATAETSPWKYVYTAIKAMLTFGIVPFAVVIGMQICTFALTTLDGIIATNSGESTINAVLGDNASDKYVGEAVGAQKDVANGEKSYSHYDAFGAHMVTSSSPFSGMLFKASAYTANRARNEDKYTALLANVKYKDGTAIFKSDNGIYDLAYQIDFAFSNCLKFKDPCSYDDWVLGLDTKENKNDDGVAVWSLTDLWKSSNVKAFSKWNVSTVWLFYDLWQFNFIVGFAGVFACFGVMVSIVFGLLTRLIKGAALFLIFPALLGIAPMDNFEAFKQWRSTFMKLILMTFGAILGMNLLLLVLPYVQNLNFFDPNLLGMGVLNAILGTIILVVGLQMVKDFINLVNGFVGGDDAVSAGSSVQQGTMKSLKTGVGMTHTSRKLVGNTMLAVGRGAVGLGKGVAKRIKHGKYKRQAADAKSNEAEAERLKREADAETEIQFNNKKNKGDAKKRTLDRANKKFDGRRDDLTKEAVSATFDPAALRASGYSDNEIDLVRRAREDSSLNTEEKRKAFIEEGLRADKSKGSAQSKIDKAQRALDSAKESAKNNTKTTALNNFLSAHPEITGFDDSGNAQGNSGDLDKLERETSTKGILKSVLKKVKGHKKGDVVTDIDGNSVLDENGNPKKYEEKSGLVGLGNDLLGQAKKFGKTFADSVQWGNIGKNIGDSLLKTIKGAQAGLGLDVLGKEMTSAIKDLKQTTFKNVDPNDKLAGKSGDDLTKQAAKQQAEKAEAQLTVLKNIERLLSKNGGSGGSGGITP